MLSILYSDFRDFGCPNCGCDSADSDGVYCYGSTTVKCRHCGLTFELTSLFEKESTIKHPVRHLDPSDENSKYVYEFAIKIPHPRKGIGKWKWAPLDEKPEEGEYFSPRFIGLDLPGFVKTKKAGERLLKMTKSVLGKEDIESWLDYRESEPDWIQFKFSSNEFDLENLYEMIRANENVVTEDILFATKKPESEIFESVFWDFVEAFDWPTYCNDYKKRATKMLALYRPKEVAMMKELAVSFRKKLQNILDNDKNVKSKLMVSDDGFSDFTAHIVGCGKNEYFKCLSKPENALKHLNDYKENFEYIFNQYKTN